MLTGSFYKVHYIKDYCSFLTMVLEDTDITDSPFIVGNYFNIPPDSTGNQHGPPVPAKITGLFPDPATTINLVFTNTPGRQIKFLIPVPQIGHYRRKLNNNTILSFLQDRFQVIFPDTVHIISSTNLPAINNYLRQGIKAMAPEDNPLIIQYLFLYEELTPVFPVSFPDPHKFFFVIPVKGIRNYTGFQ